MKFYNINGLYIKLEYDKNVKNIVSKYKGFKMIKELLKNLIRFMRKIKK